MIKRKNNMKNKTKVYKVYYSQWLNWENNFFDGCMVSAMYRSQDKKKCCLGFIGEQSGVSIDVMNGKAMPAHLWRIDGDLFPPELRVDSRYVDEIVGLNDELLKNNETKADRINKLVKKFASNGITVKFINDTEKRLPGF